MIPNFVQQILSVERDIQVASNSAADSWNDVVKERFYNSYMNAYKEKLELVVHGGPDNYGMGLEKLLIFLDQKEREMNMLERL